MKRRLNILCVIVVLVLSYSVFETGYYFIVGVKAGVEAGIDGNASGASQKKLMNMKYISLLPEHLSGLGDNGLFQDSVYNERSGEYVPVSFNSMMVSVDTESTTWGAGCFYFVEFSPYSYMCLEYCAVCPLGDFYQQVRYLQLEERPPLAPVRGGIDYQFLYGASSCISYF